MKKLILYVDMDGVVADFEKAIDKLCPGLMGGENDNSHGDYQGDRADKVNEICQANPRIFETLEPIEGSIEAVKYLNTMFDVYFLSTPMWGVPESFTGKRLWIDQYFGVKFEKRLILTHRKDLNWGHYLVDDRLKHGVDKFSGKHIHFGTEQFPNWKIVQKFLVEQFAINGYIYE